MRAENAFRKRASVCGRRNNGAYASMRHYCGAVSLIKTFRTAGPATLQAGPIFHNSSGGQDLRRKALRTAALYAINFF
jgi:hypothetical protein